MVCELEGSQDYKGKLEQEPLNRYVLIEREGRLRPRQDLEQATHSDLDVVRILKKGKGNSDRGFYAHSRFLVVRTEDHIRDPQFRKAFDQAVKNDEIYEEFKEAVERDEAHKIFGEAVKEGDFHFLETSPVEMPYIWGGDTIRTYKGLPGRRRIAETWEVSTHSAGPSAVYLNLEHSLPLSEVLFKTSRRSNLQFMAKYLDCHDKLSIQVHPSRDTAAYLYSNKTFKLKDKDGKEESFYVIHTAPHRDFRLFLGFERKSLAPIAIYLRPILLDYAGGAKRGDLQKCYAELVERLSIGLIEECVPDIAAALEIDTDTFDKEILKWTEKEKDLEHIFRYHVEKNGSDLRPGPEKEGASWPSLSLLGKEYLFAAIGIICVIESIADFVYNNSSFLNRARELFGYEVEKKSKKEIESAPLLKYFHAQQMETGQWGRVPPGTVHAWQGGGNFLIELAQCSDNTFRILDFGRELSETTSREMHYLEAMYSLSADGILDDNSSRRLIRQAEIAQTTDAYQKRKPQPCHSILNYRLFQPDAARQVKPDFTDRATNSSDDKATIPEQTAGSDNSECAAEKSPENKATASSQHWISLRGNEDKQGESWSVLMNPDNRVRIRTANANKNQAAANGNQAETNKDSAETNEEHFSELSVGRCRAVLIKPGTNAEVLPAHSGDRLLFLSPRLEREDLICISLGATKQEIALWRDGESPLIIWHKGEGALGEYDLDKVIEGVCKSAEVILGEALQALEDAEDEQDADKQTVRKLRVAVSWPGYINPEENGDVLYSSLLGDLRRSDFAAKLLNDLGNVINKLNSRKPVTYKLLESSNDNPIILNDAVASAWGESRHPLGKLLSDDPGMVLNIGSGMCAGFYPGKTKRKIDDACLAACSAVGRWLFVNPRTGRMQFRLSKDLLGEGLSLHEPKESLSNHVFRKTVNDRDGVWIRASVYLSSRGIGLRFLSRLPQSDEFNKFLKEVEWEQNKILDFLKKSDKADKEEWAIECFEDACQELNKNPKDFDRHKMIHKINQKAVGEDGVLRKLAREFIIEVAQELAEVLRQISQMLVQIDADESFREGTRHVVLTGAVGEHFGRVPAEDTTDPTDLLVTVIRRCLGNTFSVWRSEISISSKRETEGFKRYLDALSDGLQ